MTAVQSRTRARKRAQSAVPAELESMGKDPLEYWDDPTHAGHC